MKSSEPEAFAQRKNCLLRRRLLNFRPQAVKGQVIHHPALIKSALCAGLTVLCGLLLWGTSLGEPWVNASYDYLFRFGSHAVTNKVTLILMDNASFEHFHQTRGEPWDRALHAQLLNRLADDGCPLVVSDSFFHTLRDPQMDAALAGAMRRQQHMVLMAEQAQVMHPAIAGAEPILPADLFLQAVKTNWGVAWTAPDVDGIVRRQWPFPAPGPYPSLAETAARVMGAKMDGDNQELWLRYYGEDGPWTTLSYEFALSRPKGFFHDQIVFIGTQPKTTLPDSEPDEFSVPYTRWTGEASGGVKIMATTFLNLMNHDSLHRTPGWLELAVLIGSGILLGVALGFSSPMAGGILAVAASVLFSIGAISSSYYSDYWFPWLIVSMAQAPCALASNWAARYLFGREEQAAGPRVRQRLPKAPGYKLFQPAIGEGSYGKVWLVQNRAGEWKALKAVYLASFNENLDPYEREFNGITKYKPISSRHAALLQLEHVSDKNDGYFYYVMELADSLLPNWQKKPATYKPHDLAAERSRRPNKRLSVRESVQIGMVLAEALEFLHQQGFTHRDIKPQNVVFVNGQPKLADLGLVTEIRPESQTRTIVGTPGFMPPPPESPGTPQADIFSLGMVLYVIATGQEASNFPDISTALVSDEQSRDFLFLNAIILKACQPLPESRYKTATELRQALAALKEKLKPA